MSRSEKIKMRQFFERSLYVLDNSFIGERGRGWRKEREI